MNPAQARGMIRAQINQLAHLHALQYELQVKTSLLAQVQAARAGGATFDELTALVDRMETAPL